MTPQKDIDPQLDDKFMYHDFTRLLYIQIAETLKGEKQTEQDREILPVCVDCLTRLMEVEFATIRDLDAP